MVGPAHDFKQAPCLVLADRARFRDPNHIADMGFVRVIVRLKFSRPLHPLLVERVLDDALDRHDDSFFHLVADDSTGLCLDLSRHLRLLFPFRQDGLDPGDLPPSLTQPGGVFCLARRQSKSNSDKVVLCLDEPSFQFGRVEPP
jgi:hypothetical protein